jgi:Protein of unknown function (DUF1553)/Protein of unknown function (DUF1549)/Planctomycete cytochrome C
MKGSGCHDDCSMKTVTRVVTRLVAFAAFCWILLAGLDEPVRGGDDTSGLLFFESRIRPVLVEKCYTCHSSEAQKPKAGLLLDTRASARKGGRSGPALVPGNADESLLYQAISGADGVEPMPPKERLSATVAADFRRWIELGAPDPRDSKSAPERAALARAGADERTWWSLRAISRPVIPAIEPQTARWVRTPVDAFVVAKLNEHHLDPSPEADRRCLIRRLYFDLIGLAPSPLEVRAFLDDDAPEAYERLVDRLLASPHYGERWARHWMDVVHFAETHGHDQDRIRPNAWPYRDYLINAFNHDTPYGRFIEEQVAADALFPDEPRMTVALGMIAAGPWDESSLRDIRDDSIDRQIGHYIDRDDMVSTVMSTFTSVTVHCARCHDHKFDPISQQDYYSLQAVFAGVDKAERAYDADLGVSRLRSMLARRLKRAEPRDPALGGWLAAELTALPPPSLVFAAAAEFSPDAGHKPPGGPRPVHLLRRGDIHQAGAAAVPGTIHCVAGLPARFAIPASADESARRAALARWISDSKNPLTWRSIVNRVWHYHFGRGLAATPNDFGRMGTAPSHPELLDWLAQTLLDSGGSIKRLHRTIVTSAVYRQSSRSAAEFAALDTDNQWLWRQNRLRLDAESLHDALLQIAGRLDPAMHGPSVRQFSMRPGVHVTPEVDYTRYDWNGPGSGRRSVYRFLFRTLPDPFFEALDAADSSQLVAVRNESTTALQALELLNHPFVLCQCEYFARRLTRCASVLEGQLQAAFELAYSREAHSDELATLAEFARRNGLENTCRLIVNANEFLFVN